MDLINNTAILHEEIFSNENKSLWVFAYGSLCWKPEFQFKKAVKGHVQGYNRRFWQGNFTHRGTQDNPGRVATLIEKNQGIVFGIALELKGDEAIPYLSRRECELGGYRTNFTTFYPTNGNPFKVLLYVATPDNPLWLGDAYIKDIAHQIVNCSGPSGHNVEYVLRLADFMNNHFPQHNDHHLNNLEIEILKLIKIKKLCIVKLMGNGDGCITFIKKDKEERLLDNSLEQEVVERTESFEQTTKVPDKVLNCIKI